MIISLEYIQKYFNFPKKEEISKYWERIKFLGNKYGYFFNNEEFLK